jgi:adenylate cyclase
VARAAVLFSDLTGSTALYSEVGDAAAFRLVDDHFDVLRAVVDTHEGVLVKTMGDAVLAAFVDATPVRARRHRRAGALRGVPREGEARRASSGSSSASSPEPATSSPPTASLDYFGQTVNVASRVQHLAARARS